MGKKHNNKRHSASRRKNYSRRTKDMNLKDRGEIQPELETPNPTLIFPHNDFGNSGNLVEGPPIDVEENPRSETGQLPDSQKTGGSKERSS